ncbi:MAG: 3-oxoacyl-ACP reductase FabG [Anaerolineae bacterium]|nr:3-oxoacyl-ACP reductase FabG [Anaerolineae bacterium]
MSEARIALVTGGSRGIGHATCVALAAQGATVAVHYRSQASAASATAAAIHAAGGQAVAFQADLSERSGADDLIAAVLARFRRIDILVNNAAEMTDASVEAMTDEQWEQTLTLNLSAVFRCCRACLPSMKTHQWGRIINVTSQAAFTGSANHAHYAASKAGLAGFSYSLAKEVGAFGITVNLVAPGRILTDMLQERMTGREEEWIKQTPLRRFGQPHEVGDVIAFLASDKASYITGATIHVNGGMLMT